MYYDANKQPGATSPTLAEVVLSVHYQNSRIRNPGTLRKNILTAILSNASEIQVIMFKKSNIRQQRMGWNLSSSVSARVNTRPRMLSVYYAAWNKHTKKESLRESALTLQTKLLASMQRNWFTNVRLRSIVPRAFFFSFPFPFFCFAAPVNMHTVRHDSQPLSGAVFQRSGRFPWFSLEQSCEEGPCYREGQVSACKRQSSCENESVC